MKHPEREIKEGNWKMHMLKTYSKSVCIHIHMYATITKVKVMNLKGKHRRSRRGGHQNVMKYGLCI